MTQTPRSVVTPPLDAALARWQERLAAGDARDLAELLPEVPVPALPPGPVLIARGAARPYEELAERACERAAELRAALVEAASAGRILAGLVAASQSLRNRT